MAAEVLFELQDILSKPDFELIESLIVLYNHFKPEEAGQARVAFEFVLENLRERYRREFADCHKVLSINLDELEQTLIENDLNRGQRSPESEKRRNLGKTRRNCGDDDNRAMCEWSAKYKHKSELVKAAKLSDEEQRKAAIGKEHSRQGQYNAGQHSNSPLKHVEAE